MQPLNIVSTGYFLPDAVQTASELSSLIGRSENWIVSRTGVRERRIADQPMNEMAAAAARNAIGDGPPPDCIINASLTPLQLIPDSSVFIQQSLGLTGIPCWSVHATCLSFMVALNTAAGLIARKQYRRILIVSSEAGTPWRNLEEPESAALFGDAAASVIVEPGQSSENSALLDWEMGSWPEGAEYTELRGGGTRKPPGDPSTEIQDNLFHMQGPKVFRMALIRCSQVLRTLFERNGMMYSDVDRFILHQASAPAMEAYSKIGFPRERIVNVVEQYGNCIAASIPLTLALADEQGLLQRGDQVLLGGTGAGLSVAFALLRW